MTSGFVDECWLGFNWYLLVMLYIHNSLEEQVMPEWLNTIWANYPRFIDVILITTAELNLSFAGNVRLPGDL